jgi:hypothetical protein
MQSIDLESIIKALDRVRPDYEFCYEQVGLCEKKQSDILHELEIENLTQNERNKRATKLRDVRRERRRNKDAMELNERLYVYLTGQDGTRMLNQLKNILGEMRRIEEKHRTRTYRKRVKEE